jgi:protein O-mannosyl-transferase
VAITGGEKQFENPMIRLPVWGQGILIVLAGALVYGHTLGVPFYLDDFSSIFENPIIYGGGGLSEMWQYAPLRVVGYVTFAFNFQLNHTQPAGYHLVNILIHILAGLSLFVLIRGLLRTPVMLRGRSEKTLSLLPLFVALLFVVHPMQTQAVTYVVQRLSSLAALWVIVSLAFYVYGRVVQSGGLKFLLFFLSLIFAILGFLTKQNTFVIPLLIIAVEIVFFSATVSRMVWSVFVAGMAALLLWIVLASFIGYEPFSFVSLDAHTRETKDISRVTYFLTQTHVLWAYIKLFFWPVGLHLEHDVNLVETIFTWKTVIAFAGHLLVIFLAVLSGRRFPIFCFGILFYYICHLIESSFIPIRDVMFEHRAYLPNAGLCLSSGWLLVSLSGKKNTIKIVVTLLSTAILVICGTLAWQRNEIWRDPITLWHDSAINTPNKARPWNEYGKHLLQQGKTEEAITVFQDTVERIHGKNVSAGTVMEETAAINLVIALEKSGQPKAALQVADDFLKRKAKPLNKSKILTNKGNLLFRLNRLDEAELSYRQAIAIFKNNLTTMNNLAVLLMAQGRLDEAEEVLGVALSIDPKFEASRSLLERIKKMNVSAPAGMGE